MTSYLFLSMASITFLADWSETSCSAVRPPNKTATLSFFIVILSSAARARSNHFECDFQIGCRLLAGEVAANIYCWLSVQGLELRGERSKLRDLIVAIGRPK